VSDLFGFRFVERTNCKQITTPTWLNYHIKNIKTRSKQKNKKKPRKLENNNWKNWTVKKNRLKFWKNRPVQFGFGFINLKPKKTESNRQKTKSHLFEPGFALKNRTEPKPVGLNRFGFFFKNSVWLFFFDKNRTEPKIITPDKNWKFQREINPITSGGSSPECLNLAG